VNDSATGLDPRAVSYGYRLSMLAAEGPAQTAIVSVAEDGSERSISRADLDQCANRLARRLLELGVGRDSRVVLGLPNGIEHYAVTFAVWKCGAMLLPLRARLPDSERDRILAVAEPTLVIADWAETAWPTVSPSALWTEAASLPTGPLPERVPQPGLANASGGSTGRPKIIVNPDPYSRVPGQFDDLTRWAGFQAGQVQLVTGPLYHNMSFHWSHAGLFEGHRLILMERFDAGRAVDLIERHRVNFFGTVPTVMKRIADLPDIKTRDLSSISSIIHSAAFCPAWLKRAWFALIGPEKVYESFAATEGIGMTMVRGDEWLEHPGTVGRPIDCEVKILDENGVELPAGEVGEIYMRTPQPGPTYHYLGSTPLPVTDDGFATVGDLGWLDEDGYLYVADRRMDMIVTGGANVFPAEVEAALSEHPAVADVAVVGVPDEEWGRRVHAVVQPRDPANPPPVSALDQHVRDRLMSYKAPKSYEFLEELPREPTGKIRRSALAAEREGGWTERMVEARGERR
jgi:bile acid-coenzyme A ligase